MKIKMFLYVLVRVVITLAVLLFASTLENQELGIVITIVCSLELLRQFITVACAVYFGIIDRDEGLKIELMEYALGGMLKNYSIFNGLILAGFNDRTVGFYTSTDPHDDEREYINKIDISSLVNNDDKIMHWWINLWLPRN